MVICWRRLATRKKEKKNTKTDARKSSTWRTFNQLMDLKLISWQTMCERNVSTEWDGITTANWKIVLSPHFRCVRCSKSDRQHRHRKHVPLRVVAIPLCIYVSKYARCSSCIWQNICNITRRQHSWTFSPLCIRSAYWLMQLCTTVNESETKSALFSMGFFFWFVPSHLIRRWSALDDHISNVSTRARICT